ncbi:TonB-dependent receptor [Stakelama sediminis]|uniref:TonB-dependent receptor n=1 Tax=Stakelama sediminis TaxID=463200 RepID=A0A840YU67_9SPHN|nr:TonB-dependent receptor [Stakelama sediminis]
MAQARIVQPQVAASSITTTQNSTDIDKKSDKKKKAASSTQSNTSAQNGSVTESNGSAINGQAVSDIVVTAQRQALENATQMKRNSSTISDSVVLDEAGKVPSTSLLEILQRVPGLTMNRVRSGNQGSPDGFTFEGSGIQIRGLTGTKTLLNGREIFSANGGSGLNYADIGPELLRAVTVYKASRADLIAGGIAGTVNLQTFMPFDVQGTQISGSVSTSYGDFSKSDEPSASLRASTRFHTGLGEIGLLADVAYSKIKSYDSSLLVQPYYPTTYNGEQVYAPGGFYESNDQFERTRKGLYLAVQWRPASNLEFYHTTFISRWDSNRNTQYVIISQPAIGVTQDSTFDNGVFTSGGIVNGTSLASGLTPSSNASYTPSYSQTSDFSQGFKWSPGRFQLTGSYQHTTAKSGTSKWGLSVNNPTVEQANLDLTGSVPSVMFDGTYTPNAANTTLSNFNWLTMASRGHQDSYQLDATYDLGDGFFRKAAVGARYATRQETDTFVGTWWSATARGWNGVPQPNVATAPEGDFELNNFSNFFNGQAQAVGSFYVPTSQVLRGDQFNRVVNTYAACAPDLYYQCSDPTASTYLYGNPADPSFGLQPSYVTTKPKTTAAYAMVGFKNDSASPLLNFSGNIGARWVRYETESEGNYIFNGTTLFYKNTADAAASLAMMGGAAGYQAWVDAHPGENPPLSYTSNNYSTNRAGRFAKDYFLPAFNIKFQPSKSVVLRYALTETMTPPYYSDIRAQGSASVSTISNPYANDADGTSGLPAIFAGYTFTSGNPQLQPETSLNNDISIEWYPHKGTTLHLALFHKTIKHAIIFNKFAQQASSFFATADQPTSTPTDGGSAVFIDGPVTGNLNVNATNNSYIKGFELGGRTYFDMLPGFLKGFGIDANVTYVDGKSPDALALDMNGSPLNVPLIGLSKWSYSTTLLYDLNKISARVSWSWRSRYLATTSDSSTSGTYTYPSTATTQTSFGLPVYAAASGRLDASIGYQYSKHLNVRINLANITNSHQKTEMEILPGRYVQRGVFVTDRRLGVSLGFSF